MQHPSRLPSWDVHPCLLVKAISSVEPFLQAPNNREYFFILLQNLSAISCAKLNLGCLDFIILWHVK